MTSKKNRRTSVAKSRLDALLTAPPEHRAQLIDSWLEVASAAQVRRHWRRWMGQMPQWAA